MDSLTQIVLGAAVGELTQGKKLGNRAMLWGAIAGTIPDLDVFVGKLYSDPVDDLAFHRGITHSFFFAIVFSYLLSWMTVWIYDKKNYQKPIFAKVLMGALTLVLVTLLAFGGIIGKVACIPVIIILAWYGIYRYLKSKKGDQFEPISLGWKGWYKLFFWSIITHPILDCFTTYGTQVFLPFSDYRVAFNNISVADPVYTLPFLICVIMASIFTRHSQYRRAFNIAGIAISSLYMAFTFYNKHKVNQVVESSLATEGLEYNRYMTTPTILNNVLWTGTVEADSVYYQGQYSLMDEEPKVDFVTIPKNRHLVNPSEDDHTINTLKWFSDDYYNYIRKKDGRIQMNDLRFGSFSGRSYGEDDYVFNFVLEQDKDGKYKMDASESGPPRGRESDMAVRLWERINGNKYPAEKYENGAVSSAHYLATEVGVDILRKGGNAYDAAIAVNMALAVVYPRAGNIGGGGFAVIRQADGTTKSLDYREKAPKKAYKKMYQDEKGNVIPNLSLRGGLASGVPGTVRGMKELHEKYGSLPIEDLLQPAIDLAAKGYALSANEVSRLNAYRGQFEKFNSYTPCYVSTNDKWQNGDVLKNPDLATTLTRMKEEGWDEFYLGKTADIIAQQNVENGGIITKEDLKDYHVVWRNPITCSYEDYDIISMPPPSSGGIALCQILNGAEDLDLDKYDVNSADYVHHFSEIEKRVFTVRNQLMGDPDFVDLDQKLLLSDKFSTELFKDVSEKVTQVVVDSLMKSQILKEAYETTHFSVVDKDGNAVSITTTLNGNYGSLVVVKDGGFLMNNEMDDFTSKPGVPNQFGLVESDRNAIAPGKRMLSSMTPTIVEKDGKLFMVLGSPGGPTIITAVLQTFLNVVDHGMSIQEAIDAPRIHDQGFPNGILIERGRLDPEVEKALIKMGHNLRRTGYMGAVEAIIVNPDGTLSGGADYNRGKDDSIKGY